MKSFYHCKIPLRKFFSITKLKCQFLFSKNDETQLEAGDSLVKKTTEKPLAVKIDSKLSFDEQVESIC